MLNIKMQSPYDPDEEMFLVDSKTKPGTRKVRIHTFNTRPECCDWCGTKTSSDYTFKVEVINK